MGERTEDGIDYIAYVNSTQIVNNIEYFTGT